MGEIVLSQNALDQQICSECGNYLSVGTVVVSTVGQAICGRCLQPRNTKESLYNLVAQKCTFKCVNRVAGCEKLLTFKNTAEHEKTCKYRLYRMCESCDFHGNSCQMIYHLCTLHSMMKPIFGQYLFPRSRVFVDTILKMDTQALRLLICNAPRLFSTCVVCKEQFTKHTPVYACEEYHFACSNCLIKCPKCGKPSTWDKKTELHEISLQCEWPGCFKKYNMFHYLSHKQKCKSRQINCPSKKCGYAGSLQSLKEHWHLNPLVERNAISLNDFSVYYCLISRINEIVCVTFNQQETGGIISVDLENVVAPFSINVEVSMKRNDGDDMSNIDRHWEYKASTYTKYVRFFGEGAKYYVKFKKNVWQPKVVL